MAGRSRKREEVLVSPKLMPLGVSSSHLTVMDKFVTIDFEHLTPNHETACAVGMVKVINQVIVQEFYSLKY